MENKGEKKNRVRQQKCPDADIGNVLKDSKNAAGAVLAGVPCLTLSLVSLAKRDSEPAVGKHIKGTAKTLDKSKVGKCRKAK